MTPYLTRQGSALALVATLALVGGVWTGAWYAIATGQVLLLWLTLAYVKVLTWPERLRREGLYFSWSLTDAQPRLSVGASVRLKGRLHNGTGVTLTRAWPEVWCEPGLTVVEPASSFAVPRHSQLAFPVTLEARAAGRLLLHGLALEAEDRWGLIAVHLYFPHHRAITVYPAGTKGRSRLALAQGDEAATGRRHAPWPGEGTELREIRPHQQGDPFRAIEWKATARTGKLMVRQLEREDQHTSLVLVDASATMRDGPQGQRRLDFALEAAQVVADEARRRGDRVGLLAFDGRLLAHCPPAGHGRHGRFSEALLSLVDPVDEDLTDVSDQALAAAVARHLRSQAGFRLPKGLRPDSPLDQLVPHLVAAIGRRPRSSALRPRASSPALAELRRYCWEVGLRLPYRSPPRAGTKRQGLQAALEQLRHHRGLHFLVVITDLEGLEGRGETPAGETPGIWNGLGPARRRSPGLSWLVLVPPLVKVDRFQQARIDRDLARWGGRLAQAQPGEAPARALARAALHLR